MTSPSLVSRARDLEELGELVDDWVITEKGDSEAEGSNEEGFVLVEGMSPEEYRLVSSLFDGEAGGINLEEMVSEVEPGPAPSATAPSATAPSATTPSAIAPSAIVATTTTPSATAPPSTSPSATTPSVSAVEGVAELGRATESPRIKSPVIEPVLSHEPSPRLPLPLSATPAELSPLRTVLVYTELMSFFLGLASHNTSLGIETCGVLGGKVLPGGLGIEVTALMIPKQTGTKDTCSTENEEELIEVQVANDLITVGWIHTHPTQSCFMSSVDLHTHHSFQMMIPEAIAIVMSPRFRPNFGIFRLLDPEGMGMIGSCKGTGFHEHPNTPIYTFCSRHVRVSDERGKFTIFDLRARK